MIENGILEKEERKQFVRQAYIDENKLVSQQDEARKNIQDFIAEMEVDLIAKGITNEQERLQIILATMMEQEAQLQNESSSNPVPPMPNV